MIGSRYNPRYKIITTSSCSHSRRTPICPESLVDRFIVHAGYYLLKREVLHYQV